MLGLVVGAVCLALSFHVGYDARLCIAQFVFVMSNFWATLRPTLLNALAVYFLLAPWGVLLYSVQPERSMNFSSGLITFVLGIALTCLFHCIVQNVRAANASKQSSH
jgi:hypothetical protein